MSSSILLLLALGAWGMGLRADEVIQPNESMPEAEKARRPKFTPLIAAHLSRAIASGVDRYGPDETNLWLSSIDVVNGGLPEESTPQRRRWYRSIHSPCGSNLYWDQPLIVAAYALGEQTGDERFAAAADRYVKGFLRHCVAEETGLFLWGNHLYYHVVEDRPVGFSGGHHEMRPHTAAWDVFWRIDREATQRQIQAMFQQHVVDKTTGRFDRHANPSKVMRGTSSNSMPFLEAGAVLVESLAWLAKTDEENASKLTEQALLVARYSYDQRDRNTGLLRNQPSVRRWDYSVCTSEIGLWAGSLLRASEYTGNREFQDMAQSALAAWIERAWDDQTGLYYGQLSVETGKPVKQDSYDYPHMPRYHADIWEKNLAPTHNYPLPTAEACLTLFQRTSDPRFRTAAERWITHIRNSLPASHDDKGNKPTAGYAGEYGRVIHFLVGAAEVFDQPRLAELAGTVAEEAIKRLYVKEHAMFRTHPGEDRAEAVDGLGVLFLALMYLETGREADLRGFAF